jgi:hydroxyacylglutathione hydrolase
MYIQQLYTNCLSEAAYYIESNGEAAIIDPLRDTDVYVALAKERGANIKYIFETHFHADFVSGHIDLSAKVNAPIIYGPNAYTSYKVYNAKDGEIFTLGALKIKALHTPGHTLESTCYLLKDENDKDHALFTGDTLFIGDVGRPDLFGATLSKEDMAEMLYESLDLKIKPLADDVIVFPAHGPGSSCGKNIGPEKQSTIGLQKESNYALQEQTKEAFVKAVTTGLAEPPQYFPLNAKINKEGYDSLALVLQQGLTALNVGEFKSAITDKTIILDTRPATTFTQGFIPTSIFIGLEGRFAEFAGTLLPADKQILLVCDEGKAEEAITRLARIGYDNVIGYLDGGFAAWQTAKEAVDIIIDIEADELAMDLKFDDNIVIMDVRKQTEFDAGHLKEARLNTLQDFITNPVIMATIEDEDNVYIHCAGGYRSVIACSLLKREDIHNIRNILGGFAAIKENAEIEIEKTAAVKSAS